MAERRAEMESQLLALDRAVRQMDARAEEQDELLRRISANLDLIARQSAAASSRSETSEVVAAADTARAAGGDASEVADSGSPATDVYQAAFADYTRGSYTLARQGFEEVLRRFPDSEFADDAAYWIAETHYAQGNPETALRGFRSILENYPRGDSITASLLKIGYCHLELGDEDAAREAFGRLRREFPESDEALVAEHKLSTLTGGG